VAKVEWGLFVFISSVTSSASLFDLDLAGILDLYRPRRHLGKHYGARIMFSTITVLLSIATSIVMAQPRVLVFT
jgi:hypothetical protein